MRLLSKISGYIQLIEEEDCGQAEEDARLEAVAGLGDGFSPWARCWVVGGHRGDGPEFKA